VSARAGANAPIPSLAFDLEAGLERAFGSDPTPAQLAAIERRVSAVMAAPRPVASQVHRRRRRWAAVLLAAATLVVLVGAGTSLLSMYPNLGGGGYRVAWDRSTKLGLSQVHDGYQVRLEAAYADAAQTMLAISVQDTEGGRSSQVGINGVDLTDEAGRTYQMASAGSTPADRSSSVNTVWFDTPGDGSLSGSHHFVATLPDIGVREVDPTFSVLPDVRAVNPSVAALPVDPSTFPWHSVAGPWRFQFDLAVAPATRLSPAATATTGGVTATLESIIVSPTTVRLKMTYAGLPDGAESWTAIATVLHDGKRLAVGSSMVGPGAAGEELTTVAGTDNPSGPWVIQIDELVGFGPQDQIRLAGPWVISFVAP
jgi:hypothetical protein